MVNNNQLTSHAYFAIAIEIVGCISIFIKLACPFSYKNHYFLFGKLGPPGIDMQRNLNITFSSDLVCIYNVYDENPGA
jgi:hypothetical protein